MADLLIEIGCEELPAASIEPMARHLASELHRVLVDNELTDGKVEWFGTPRRLAVRCSDVSAAQSDRMVERRGPSMAAAYKDGEPSKALSGFLRSAGATVDDVSTVDTPKGQWVVLHQKQAGRSMADIVNEALPAIVKGLPMPKRMRWSDQPHEFLRPVVWLLALHGSSLVPLTLLGLEASNTTRGHRFHAPEPVVLDDASAYESALAERHVIARFAERRGRIVEQVRRCAAELGGHPVMDEALIDECTGLVEWPVALAGQFDAHFLEIPKEALIQTMQENQRYFALLDDAGKLMPAFITISNIDSNRVETVVDGNERVIRPRFADTMFFWNQDKQHTLAELAPELERVLFQEKLGSVADKQRRLQTVVKALSEALQANAEHAILAAGMAKCDLVTEIVKELPKMQGIAGQYYARRDGHPDSVALAMEQHYFPKQAGGALPEDAIGQIVALADKVDTLVGIHGQGLIPTGAKDPFGLRRASLGILRILIEAELDLDLATLVSVSANSYAGCLDNIDQTSIVAYVIERLRGYLVEQGYAGDAVEAVLAKSLTHPLDIERRLKAIDEFRNSDAAVSLAAASKRIGNLLRKAEQGDNSGLQKGPGLQKELLVDEAEITLAEALAIRKPVIEAHLQDSDYARAMTVTAELRTPVDVFFDAVMVMVDDTALRDNRLALLGEVDRLCCSTAELSLLDARSRS